MLISVKNLYGHRVATSEGLTGKIIDLDFDDRTWAIRHLVASPNSRREKAVLLSPALVRNVDSRENLLHTDCTRLQYDQLPSGNSILPVCLQYNSRPGLRPTPARPADAHLRCVSAILGNEIHDAQQHLGIIHDLLVDSRHWNITFLVGRRFGLLDGDFLVDATSVSQISFATRRVTIRQKANWDLVFSERTGYGKILEQTAAL